MPASLFHESEHVGGNSGQGLEDQRAFQLALELSLLGFSDTDTLGTFDPEGAQRKKSQNTTECVPVPSSEHVAEIVGRQGCKIKALRAKTNTYIKTPVRGEEPVFVVTGRKEDVQSAKREILSAAEHFSQIRAQRKSNLSGTGGVGLGPGPNANIPGHTTIQVRVPYRVVGLVVGPKGATIKRIQQQTSTYIITPSREKEPIFEVTGLPESVETARKEIESHIAVRTGGVIGENGHLIDPLEGAMNEPDPFSRSGANTSPNSDSIFGSSNRSNQHLNNMNGGSFGSLYKSDSAGDSFGSFSSFNTDSQFNSAPGNNLFSSFSLTTSSKGSMKGPVTTGLSDIYTPFGSAFSSSAPSAPNAAPRGPFGGPTGLHRTTSGLYESDEGLGDSPTFVDSILNSANGTGSTSSPSTGSVWPDFSKGFGQTALMLERRSSSLGSEANSTSSKSSTSGGNTTSNTSSSPGEGDGVDHQMVRRLSSSDALTVGPFVNPGFAGLSTSTSTSPTESLTSNGKGRKDCLSCFEKEVNAVLIPCGHNHFCMDCANNVCTSADPKCPVCQQTATQAVKIIS